MVAALPCKSCNSSADLTRVAPGQLVHMQQAVTTLLRGLGEDPEREGLRDTPRVSGRPGCCAGCLEAQL